MDTRVDPGILGNIIGTAIKNKGKGKDSLFVPAPGLQTVLDI